MENIAVVTGADRGLGLALTVQLAEKSWRVFAGQFMPDWPELGEAAKRYADRVTIVPLDVSSEASAQMAAQRVAQAVDHVDMLISNAGVNSLSRDQTIREGIDYEEMHRLYDINSLGALRMMTAFLPLMDKGTMKRLCFVSSEAGSIERARRKMWYCYCMSKAALNMGIKILFNDLRPEGYAFRVYHPGGIRSYIGGSGVKGTKANMEPEEAAVPALAHFLGDARDEDQLVMMDWRGEAWPW